MEINDDAWMDEQYDKKIDTKINRITDLKLQPQEQNKIVKTSSDVKQINNNLCQWNVKLPHFILRIIIPNIVEKLKEM